jgi:hypothetical protein
MIKLLTTKAGPVWQVHNAVSADLQVSNTMAQEVQISQEDLLPSQQQDVNTNPTTTP